MASLFALQDNTVLKMEDLVQRLDVYVRLLMTNMPCVT
jgi:hypothetical protein